MRATGAAAPGFRTIACFIGLAALQAVAQAEPDATVLHVQVSHGAATRAVAFGARRALPWQADLGGLVLTAHGEIELGRWQAEQAGGDRRGFTQLTVAPVLQLGSGRWFGEAGVGPSWLTPPYRSRQRAFSSRLQFRDHLAVGARLGAHGEHTVDVRVVHVSNGGVDHPNPGLEVVGVRYARRW